MLANDFSQRFLFTFRPNGQANSQDSIEVLVEELADYDPSAAADSYKRSWFGTEDALLSMLNALGFTEMDVEGILAALKSHRTADRKLTVTPDQLQDAGFGEVV